MIICGRKMTTLPTPAMTPSAIRLEKAVSPRRSNTAAPRSAAPASIASMSGVAQANTAWNTVAITTNSPSVPGTGLLKKSVMRVRQDTKTGAFFCTLSRTVRTHVYRMRASRAIGGSDSNSSPRTSGNCARAASLSLLTMPLLESVGPSMSSRSSSAKRSGSLESFASRAAASISSGQTRTRRGGVSSLMPAMAFRNKSSPAPVVATTGYTGTPSNALSSAVSTWIPLFSAASVMVNATTVGSSSSVSCCKRNRPW